jgi:GNAT superfamily N-acetyltransferase
VTTPSQATPSPATLPQATQNAAALWTALAEVRGHELARRPGFIAMTGDERSGARIVLLSPEADPAEVTEAAGAARRRSGGAVLVEDPFGTVDAAGLGLTPRQLPVMTRAGGAVAASSTVTVTRARRADQLAVVERIVVAGFPVESFQPYHPGEAFPAGLLDYPGVTLFLASRGGTPAGACLTIVDGTVGGVYWVTTLPEHRSRGVGRALMHEVLCHLNGMPVTLTAARPGKPLYDSLGFQTLADATWWM